MTTFLTVLTGVAIIAIYWLYDRYRKRKKIKQQLADFWGKKKTREHNWAQIRYYHDILKRQKKHTFIDDDTWEDLNFNDLFKQMDRTLSNIGQQVLYSMLRRPVSDDEILQQREQWIQLFARKPDFRIDLQAELRTVTSFRIWRLPQLIFEELPTVPQWFRAFLIMPILAVLSAILGLIAPIFWVGLIVIPVVNMGIQYLVGHRIARYTAALSALQPLLSATEEMGKIDEQHDHPLGEFGQEFREQYLELRKLRKRVGNFLHEGNPDHFATIVWDYLNILFLLKTNLFALSVREIARNQNVLQEVYYKVGYLDAMIAVASFRAGLERQCKPTFHRLDESLRYRQVYHPLLKDPVPNSIHVKDKGILVTGSNMSGKTTFLRTIGVNQILAQTFNFCCAEEAELTFCNVISSMRREDDLTEGKSFYLGEVERVKTLVDRASDRSERSLFLLDEIFRGTNTIERISASLEVLKWLKRSGHFVLASTHDLELVDLLEDAYLFYHFSEDIGAQTLTFDHRIKPGPSSTKNAIRLLDINDYPQEIVDGALKISQELEEQGVINHHQKKHSPNR